MATETVGVSPQATIQAGLTELVRLAHGTARDKGWHDPAHPATFGDRIALVHSELSEALEEFRNGHATNDLYLGDDGKPEGVPAELADVVIRIADLCGAEGIDLAAAVEAKLVYNATRPHRHGGKVI